MLKNDFRKEKIFPQYQYEKRSEDFSKQKIVYPDISQKLSFSLCKEPLLCSNTAYFITAKDSSILPILVDYLNSKLIDWYYRTLSVQLGESAIRMFSIYVLNIPIAKPTLESNIYESYGLTKEEINFIENREV